MSCAKWVAAAVVAAISLSACGAAGKPKAGTLAAKTYSKQHVYDARTKHAQCLREDHIPYHYKTQNGYPTIQVMTRPSGPTIEYLTTPGAAQNKAMTGQAQGAEAIGSQLLFPNQASDALLNKVETCATKDVSG